MKRAANISAIGSRKHTKSYQIRRSTISEGSIYGLASARCCNYSYTCSWWWVEVPPKTRTAVYRNIINCI